MLVYNIRKAKYANVLKASGAENRWNKEDEFIIYTGNSIALAMLEMIAHKSGIAINQGYKLLSIKLDIDPSTDIIEIEINELPPNWKSISSYPDLQKKGSDWYTSNQSLLLKVPSVLAPHEYNYLINTRHPDFTKKVTLEAVETVEWDNRLLQ